MKKVFVVHGWGGYPQEGWFPWLKKELGKNGIDVNIPTMPNTDEPKINEWVSFLKEQIKDPDKDTYFVGHSIGCQAIMRYLESLQKNIKIGGIVFVAGWFNLKNLGEEEMKIAKPWLETTIHTDKILKHIQKIVAIFSDNDPYVPQSDSKIFEDKLGAEIIIEHKKGHFSGDDGIKELPVVLKSLTRFFP